MGIPWDGTEKYVPWTSLLIPALQTTTTTTSSNNLRCQNTLEQLTAAFYRFINTILQLKFSKFFFSEQ